MISLGKSHQNTEHLTLVKSTGQQMLFSLLPKIKLKFLGSYNLCFGLNSDTGQRSDFAYEFDWSNLGPERTKVYLCIVCLTTVVDI